MTITIAPTTQPPHWAPSPSPSSPSPTSTSNTIVHHGPNPHHHHHHHHPSPSPSLSSTTTTNSIQSQSLPMPPPPPQSKLPVDFSPPLIAMVVIVAAAFLIVTYSRLISRHLLPPLLAFTNRFRHRRHRHRRRPPSSVGDMESPPYDPSAFHTLSPYGLDDSAIKTIPISLFTKTNNHNNNNKTTSSKDSSASACCCCAVCLVEFEDNDYVRTLPVCSHAFHVDCIDVWLRSHANCPLCRAGIFAAESPFIPVMASRIRPSFVDVDDSLMLMTNFMPLVNNSENSFADSARSPVRSFSTVTEIIPCAEESPRRSNLTNSEERRFSNGGNNSSACRDDMLLKRSYSFGFERSLAAERMLMMEPSTASPWRLRRSNGGVGFWSKRLSPFATSLTKSRVFSFRHYRGGGGGGGGGGGMNVKYSPFFIRRRGGLGFFPLSERFNNISGGGGGGSSRRTKSLTSPMFMRSSASGTAAFSSSRLRCGDPEALLSPERFNRR